MYSKHEYCEDKIFCEENSCIGMIHFSHRLRSDLQIQI